MASYDVFTPTEVATKMQSYFPHRIQKLLEPSVGEGNLLNGLEYDDADLVELNSNYLSKVPYKGRKVCGDFLAMDLEPVYDGVIMNPPFLRFQDMPEAQRKQVRAISPILKKGNIDLYVAFVMKALSLLRSDGTLVAIVPSTWLYNKSCAGFRDYLWTERFVERVWDYGSQKVFPSIDVYCCILVLSKTPKTHYWRNEEVHEYGSTSEEVGETLDQICHIGGGLATLCDAVFIHGEPLFREEPCWRPILKVSKNQVKSIIYPYDAHGAVIEEEAFKAQNPRTWEYLKSQQNTLSQRDKGNGNYEAWYAYGRRQGLHIPSAPESVYISSLCSPEVPTLVAPTQLFYSGLRLTPNDGVSCKRIQEVIERNKVLLNSLCSKRSQGWINVGSSALKQLPL